MENEEIVEIFEEFLNENGQWIIWKEWAKKKGIDLEELGFTGDFDDAD